MKILLKSLSLGLILTVIFSLIPFTAQCKSLEKDIFRLHILANSDSESDQELKLKVRDKVLSYTEDLYKDCETKEDTVKVTENNLVKILNVAQKEVYNLGYKYKVKGEITNMYFNTRQYGKFTVPSGFYDALRITIGKGKGHNWWCVMYPSICISSESEKDSKAREVFDQKQYDIVKNEQYQYKFKIVELFEQFCSSFENQKQI